MKVKKLFALLLAAPLFLGSCIMNNGICYEHVDANKDGICDVCGHEVKLNPSGEGGGGTITPDIPGNPCTTHIDHDLDGKCDNCGADMSIQAHEHIDADQDGHCDICGASMIVCNDHKDNNGDGYCDICGAVVPNIPIGSDVTIYLVLSSVGTLDGIKGISYGDFNLEYTYRLQGKVGDPLPGKDRVGHIYNSADFEAWVAYEGTGAPTVYTTVPAVNNKILYAQFTPNGNTPSELEPTDPEVDTTSKQFTLKTNFNNDQYWDKDGCLIAAYAWDDNGYSRAFEGHLTTANTYTFDIYVSFKHLLFIRGPKDISLVPLDWDRVWNQTDNLDIPEQYMEEEANPVAQITSWDGGNWDAARKQNHSTVSWVE